MRWEIEGEEAWVIAMLAAQRPHCYNCAYYDAGVCAVWFIDGGMRMRNKRLPGSVAFCPPPDFGCSHWYDGTVAED